MRMIHSVQLNVAGKLLLFQSVYIIGQFTSKPGPSLFTSSPSHLPINCKSLGRSKASHALSCSQLVSPSHLSINCLSLVRSQVSHVRLFTSAWQLGPSPFSPSVHAIGQSIGSHTPITSDLFYHFPLHKLPTSPHLKLLTSTW